MKKIVLILFLLITSISNSLAIDNTGSIRAKISKALQINNYRVENYSRSTLLEGGYGLSGEYQVNILDDSYVGFHFGFNIFDINDSLNYSSNKKLKVTSADILVTITREFKIFNGYNLFVGLGAGITYFNTNEAIIVDSDDNNILQSYSTQKLFPGYSFVLNPRVGGMVPIGDRYFALIDADANFIFARKLGIIPKISFGFGYWLN